MNIQDACNKNLHLQYFRERGKENLNFNFKNILLVRASEDSNNHYFRTLRNSGVWEAYCGVEAYTQIHSFTGFDVYHWLQNNINWQEDLTEETYQYFVENKLLSYLEW